MAQVEARRIGDHCRCPQDALAQSVVVAVETEQWTRAELRGLDDGLDVRVREQTRG